MVTLRVQRKTIGLLAGMGVRSTAPFLDMLIEECQLQYGARHETDYPPMVIFSWPIPFYSDRPVDHEAMRATIADGLAWLQRTGVDFIAMPCNTAHIYFDHLANLVSVPLLNMVEEAVDALPTDSAKIALLATRATRDSGLYQPPLERRGFEILATDSIQQEIDRLLTDIRRVSDLTPLRQRWTELLNRVTAEGADAALIACTDLNAVSGSEAPDGLQLLDGTRVLARRVVATWRSFSAESQHRAATAGTG